MVSSEEREDIKRMIEEDLHSGDVTSESLIDEDTKAKGKIIAGESGYIAGIEEASLILEELNVEMNSETSNGNKVEKGDIICIVKGTARGILAAERVALNILSRMSGVATATREMIEKAKEVDPDVQIAATRKTIPLLRRFDKRAVEIAGGEPHRYHLGDFVLIKDNHLKLVGSVEKAVELAQKAGLSEKIEVEVTNEKEAISAAKTGADIVMLDNFEAEEAEETVETLKKAGLREDVVLEASGGIDPTNVEDYASTGVDIISASYMTMQAPALDIKLEISEEL